MDHYIFSLFARYDTTQHFCNVTADALKGRKALMACIGPARERLVASGERTETGLRLAKQKMTAEIVCVGQDNRRSAYMYATIAVCLRRICTVTVMSVRAGGDNVPSRIPLNPSVPLVWGFYCRSFL